MIFITVKKRNIDYFNAMFTTPPNDSKNFNSINRLNDRFFREILPSYFNSPCRDGQLDMSQDVIDCLQSKYKKNKSGNLMIEAGVGIGKSFAYLVPLLLYNHHYYSKVVLSTSSILLQNQLENDIKLLFDIFEQFHIRITYPQIIIAKGKNRYICIERLNNYGGCNDEIIKLKEDYKKSGKIREIEDCYSEIYPEICVKKCIKRNCKVAKGCSFNNMRSNAKNGLANLFIITNHDMFIQDRKLYDENPEYSLFKDVNYVVFDEAHNLEDKVRNAYLFTISSNSLLFLTRRITDKKTLGKNENIDRECTALNQVQRHLFDKLFINVEKKLKENNDKEKPLRIEFDMELYISDFQNLLSSLAKIKEEVMYANMFDIAKSRKSSDNNTEDSIKDLQISLNQFENYISAILDSNPNYLTWIEFTYDKSGKLSKKSLEINTSIKNIGKSLQKLVFENKKMGAILTSATLSSSSNSDQFDDPEDAYSYISKSLGLTCDQNYTLLNEPIFSPYNYKENMRIYIDSRVPAQKDNNHFIPELTNSIIEALNFTHGRTLILFTSKYDMNEVYKKLIRLELPYQIYKQGGNNFKVLEKFREDEQSILLSTGNFWEGINVPGRTLSQVMIARLPFPVPDPILNDKKIRFLESGHSDQEFMNEILIPEMMIKLRQGLGRLIRKDDDKGIITILDSRISSSSKVKYKDEVIKSLPIKITESRQEIIQFVKEKLDLDKDISS